MKLPLIQKYDLQVILLLSIQFPNNNEYFEEICLNGHESIHQSKICTGLADSISICFWNDYFLQITSPALLKYIGNHTKFELKKFFFKWSNKYKKWLPLQVCHRNFLRKNILMS